MWESRRPDGRASESFNELSAAGKDSTGAFYRIIQSFAALTELQSPFPWVDSPANNQLAGRLPTTVQATFRKREALTFSRRPGPRLAWRAHTTCRHSRSRAGCRCCNARPSGIEPPGDSSRLPSSRTQSLAGRLVEHRCRRGKHLRAGDRRLDRYGPSDPIVPRYDRNSCCKGEI